MGRPRVDPETQRLRHLETQRIRRKNRTPERRAADLAKDNATRSKRLEDPAYRKRHNEWQRANWAKSRKNPDFVKRNRRYMRNYQLTRKYGMSLEEWLALFERQGSRCACCGATSPGSKIGWTTDHDHETNKVRGILCHVCNLRLGQLGDSRDVVEKRVHQFLTYLNKGK